MTTKVINLYAGPSGRKSTFAAELFSRMKAKHINVEIAPEFAKELVWDKDFVTLDNQIYVSGEQHRRLYRLLDNVEYIITDCPLLLGWIYAQENCKKFKYSNWLYSFKNLLLDLYDQYDNKNYLIERVTGNFDQQGRIQNEDESIEKDKQIEQFLIEENVLYKKIFSVDEILVDLQITQ